MLQALDGFAIVEYQEPDTYVNIGGLFHPSEATRRRLLKQKDQKEFRADAPPPDIIRCGTLVSGFILGLEQGARIFFNKHDADQFEYDGKTYYRLKTKYIEAEALEI